MGEPNLFFRKGMLLIIHILQFCLDILIGVEVNIQYVKLCSSRASFFAIAARPLNDESPLKFIAWCTQMCRTAAGHLTAFNEARGEFSF